MTETSPAGAPPTPGRSPQAEAVSDFGIDTTSRSTTEAVGDYLAKVRGGELGSLPALFGLVVLLILFSVASDSFLTLGNIANLLAQGAGVTIIAMGLVFVLLLGEIDLSAGTASGVTAAVLALHLVTGGNLLGKLGIGVFALFCLLLLVAIGIAVQLKIWYAVAPPAIALLIVLIGFGPNPWLEMVLAICVGTAIGLLTGFLVSRIGIPSFVVTLALFLAWQGVILQFIGDGGTLSLQNDTLFAVANGNLPPWASWVLFVLAGGGYAAVVLGRHYRRLRIGLVTQPTPLVLTKVAVVVVLAAIGTFLLALNRSQSSLIVISGVPYVVPIILVLLVAGTYVLDRTSYGRHIYAVGGNIEAARRAGVNVPRIRASVFVVSASMAAVGAIVYSSKVGSVDPNAGNGTVLLYAVGAAVIGGTSLFGGRGRMSNAVIGGTVIAMVQNGLGLLKQPASVVLVVTGVVLLLAAAVDALSRRRSAVR
ncbi:MAG: D-xylose transport system permease protein [Pseudonocardiales bacterium]|jgi:D-xylose transport system permease protein|nr:Inner-rane translocator [Pseudonocardia sp.]MDT7556035.1 D-xylose transport system permease protein [Pseudonocardiales bacterium]MDT7569093.1 D-xylose transport system permease protein [Pseudonocardiales bacterium]MDT7585179.1 D-xylose transport system permease protein [Pseudonocardiales bacterium]MDT7591955.1 D-xylose transport system permease protein [Pseudonocardiales bacterium]